MIKYINVFSDLFTSNFKMKNLYRKRAIFELLSPRNRTIYRSHSFIYYLEKFASYRGSRRIFLSVKSSWRSLLNLRAPFFLSWASIQFRMNSGPLTHRLLFSALLFSLSPQKGRTQTKRYNKVYVRSHSTKGAISILLVSWYKAIYVIIHIRTHNYAYIISLFIYAFLSLGA